MPGSQGEIVTRDDDELIIWSVILGIALVGAAVYITLQEILK